MSEQSARVIVALDFSSAGAALQLVDQLEPSLCQLKVGKELFTAAGPEFVSTLVKRGYAVFLDLKFHDIPNTVAAASSVAADLGVWMLNVHASGGRRMMEAAADRLANHRQRPLLIGVTILTSLAEADIHEIGYSGSPEDNVLHLAELAESSGLDGIVCSPREAEPVRRLVSSGFKLVTPGVRPAFANADDQKRIMTPADAIAAGASYLVVGRPVTAAAEPLHNLALINDEVNAALASR